jgi:hypothetical protein
MRYRVILWGTGLVGKLGLRALIEHPDFGSFPVTARVDLSRATGRRLGSRLGSSRQGCESSGVRVPVPSIARFGRLAYPIHVKATTRVLLGWKRHGCPAAVPLRWERPGWQANWEA